MIKHSDTYWVSCDGGLYRERCKMRTPGRDTEDGALESAALRGWWLGDDGQHFCNRHTPTCGNCGDELLEDGSCEDPDCPTEAP